MCSMKPTKPCAPCGALLEAMAAPIQAIAAATHIADVFAPDAAALFEVIELEPLEIDAAGVGSPSVKRAIHSSGWRG
jgi:hypothetical protein